MTARRLAALDVGTNNVQEVGGILAAPKLAWP